MLETAPIDYTMEDLRNFRTRLNHFRHHGGRPEDLRNEIAKIQPTQKHWAGGYNLVDSEWEEIATEDFPMVLNICIESDAELAEYIAEFEGDANLSEYLEPFHCGRRILKKCAQQMRTMLRRRGVSLQDKQENKAEQLAQKTFTPHLTRHQAKLSIIQKFEELKRQSPPELHEDLDRACRQALQQLDKQ